MEQNTMKSAATIGVFDGVHRGHRFLIDQLKEEARRRGMPTMVITFGVHPRQVLCPDWHPQLLTPLEEKETLLRATGVDRVVVLPFDMPMSKLSARDFMDEVLLKELGVGLLLTGYDNHFGHREQGKTDEGFDDYMAYGRELGIEVVGAKPLTGNGICYSSSLVRRLVGEEGDVAKARKCLGRPYRMEGVVDHGQQMGRKLGFPTANQRVDNPDKLIPREGVYATLVYIEGRDEPLMGMTNIGHRPTFHGDTTTHETHILDFQGDLYGQRIFVDFIERVREEQFFYTPSSLIGQMRIDAKCCRLILEQKRDDEPSTR